MPLKKALIKSLFGKDSVTYLEFFPMGIKEYGIATKANVETLINRMVNVANVHAVEVGNDFINNFINIQNNFVAARSTQLSKQGCQTATVSKEIIDDGDTAMNLELIASV